MFTGIVEAIGTVQQIQELDYSETGGSGYSLIITECSDLLNDITLGDSIAVNGKNFQSTKYIYVFFIILIIGICLTATELTPSKDKSTALYASVKFQISPETLRLTNLIDLSVGSKVNLERAMKADQRLSGHMVIHSSHFTHDIITDLNAPSTFKLTHARTHINIYIYIFTCINRFKVM